MPKSNENTHTHTHAAPKLVNRPSPYTLRRPCDLGHGHDKTSKWSNNEAQLLTQQRRSENKIMQTRERTRKRHRNATKSTFSYVSQHIKTLQRTLHNGRYVLFSSTVLQPTLTRTINGNTSLAPPKMLTQKQVCEGTENFVNTHGGPTPGNTNCRLRIRGKKRTHMKLVPPTMCEHKTRPPWHRPHLKQSNFASP